MSNRASFALFPYKLDLKQKNIDFDIKNASTCQSSESLRRSWNKMLKVTSQHPFKLRTEVHCHTNFLSKAYL